MKKTTWWASFEDRTVWPVEILSVNMFGVRVRSTHSAAPAGEHVFPATRVYDSSFRHPTSADVSKES